MKPGDIFLHKPPNVSGNALKFVGVAVEIHEPFVNGYYFSVETRTHKIYSAQFDCVFRIADCVVLTEPWSPTAEDLDRMADEELMRIATGIPVADQLEAVSVLSDDPRPAAEDGE